MESCQDILHHPIFFHFYNLGIFFFVMKQVRREDIHTLESNFFYIIAKYFFFLNYNIFQKLLPKKEILVVLWLLLKKLAKMMTMTMIMMMINCFCGMVDQWKAFNLISTPYHCRRLSPSRISDTLWAGIAPVQNLISGFLEWSCVVVKTTTPRLWNLIGIKFVQKFLVQNL